MKEAFYTLAPQYPIITELKRSPMTIVELVF